MAAYHVVIYSGAFVVYSVGVEAANPVAAQMRAVARLQLDADCEFVMDNATAFTVNPVHDKVHL
ncbi:hypothetical protein ACO0LL_05720 [Undibacterium sp. TC4M20W]|uniref:hypothetical protein n=1 Tax=Undibacterium sp. TC4M20W TaxID=3413052 RepID=UPI003BEF5F77